MAMIKALSWSCRHWQGVEGWPKAGTLMAVVAIIVIVVFTVIIAPWESPVQAVGGAWR
jgi:hypothetical protein